MALGMFSGLLSLLAALSPADLPADVTAETWLAAAPDDTLIAVYLPRFALDYASLEGGGLLQMIEAEGWPPDEDDFPEALKEYELAELIELADAELLILGLPWEEADEWEDDTAFFMRARPNDPAALELAEAIIEEGLREEELVTAELPFNPGDLRAFTAEDGGLLAVDSDSFYFTADIELFTRVYTWNGPTLGGLDSFEDAFSDLESAAAVAVYLDLGELLARERAADIAYWEQMREEYPEDDYQYEPEPPGEFELSLDKLAGTLDLDGDLNINLLWTDQGVVEHPLYRAFVEARRAPELAALVPTPCTVFGEFQLQGVLEPLISLIEEDAGEAPPEIDAVLAAAAEHLTGRYGFSIHALQGRPQSEVLEEFIDDVIDFNMDFADPRLIVYAESPDSAALLESVEDTLIEYGVATLPRSYGGVGGLEIIPADADGDSDDPSLHLFPLNDTYLGVTVDELSAEWILGQFAGRGVLAEEESFRTSAAAVNDPVSLVFHLDMASLLKASEPPEMVETMSEFLGAIQPLGLNLSVLEDRLGAQTDAAALESVFGLFFGMVSMAFEEPYYGEEATVQSSQSEELSNKE